MTITKREVQPKARITYDEMEAFLTLPVPKEALSLIHISEPTRP